LEFKKMKMRRVMLLAAATICVGTAVAFAAPTPPPVAPAPPPAAPAKKFIPYEVDVEFLQQIGNLLGEFPFRDEQQIVAVFKLLREREHRAQVEADPAVAEAEAKALADRAAAAQVNAAKLVEEAARVETARAERAKAEAARAKPAAVAPSP
jgi:Spy/CpxP family protein refolding chaperone